MMMWCEQQPRINTNIYPDNFFLLSVPTVGVVYIIYNFGMSISFIRSE